MNTNLKTILEKNNKGKSNAIKSFQLKMVNESDRMPDQRTRK